MDSGDRERGPVWTCDNGHAISPGDEFCSRCGANVRPDGHSGAQQAVQPGSEPGTGQAEHATEYLAEPFDEYAPLFSSGSFTEYIAATSETDIPPFSPPPLPEELATGSYGQEAAGAPGLTGSGDAGVPGGLDAPGDGTPDALGGGERAAPAGVAPDAPRDEERGRSGWSGAGCPRGWGAVCAGRSANRRLAGPEPRHVQSRRTRDPRPVRGWRRHSRLGIPGRAPGSGGCATGWTARRAQPPCRPAQPPCRPAWPAGRPPGVGAPEGPGRLAAGGTGRPARGMAPAASPGPGGTRRPGSSRRGPG